MNSRHHSRLASHLAVQLKCRVVNRQACRQQFLLKCQVLYRQVVLLLNLLVYLLFSQQEHQVYHLHQPLQVSHRVALLIIHLVTPVVNLRENLRGNPHGVHHLNLLALPLDSRLNNHRAPLQAILAVFPLVLQLAYQVMNQQISQVLSHRVNLQLNRRLSRLAFPLQNRHRCLQLILQDVQVFSPRNSPVVNPQAHLVLFLLVNHLSNHQVSQPVSQLKLQVVSLVRCHPRYHHHPQLLCLLQSQQLRRRFPLLSTSKHHLCARLLMRFPIKVV